MGATTNIRETNITLKLVDQGCDKCLQKFTEQEISERNFDLWFDTTNDVELEPIGEWYKFSIWIRNIEHQDCPEK